MNHPPLNRDSAKLILSVYPVEGCGEPDELMMSALQMAEHDPELREWFKREQERKAALSKVLNCIEPPADLKASILAGAAVTQAERGRRSWWNRRALLAAAAVLLLSAIGAAVWMTRPYTGGEYSAKAYRHDMTTYLSRFFMLDFENEKVADVQSWLEKNHRIEDFEIPPELASHPSLGCEVIRWHDLRAYLICFDVNDEVVHLFLLPGGAKLDGAPQETEPQFVALSEDWEGATWNSGDDVYFLATLGSKELLQGVLEL